MTSMIALVDCENFYVSCERAFRPDLKEHPVVVLSNNDGCVVSRSHEVRAAGIGMAQSYYQCKKALEDLGAVVFSSNYTLYADMSRRVMTLLAKAAAECVVYSIDEAFLRFPAMAPHELGRLGKRLRRRIKQATGIPVRFGFGETKTLAKLASTLAKCEPDGIYVLPKGEEREEVLSSVEVQDVWGIGRRRATLLRRHGVQTARDLRDLPDRWVKRQMTVTGLRTVWELRGTECLSLDDAPPSRNSLVRSRSFGRTVYDRKDLAEAIATRTDRAAEKLRAEGLVARGLQVYITTRHFGKGPHYSNTAAAALPRPTSYTPELTKAAKKLLGRIYRRGYPYRKAGVTCYDLRTEDPEQGHLFVAPDSRKATLVTAMDRINQQIGSGSVRLAATGLQRTWEMQRSMKSPAYTTRWDELPVVRA